MDFKFILWSENYLLVIWENENLDLSGGFWFIFDRRIVLLGLR